MPERSFPVAAYAVGVSLAAITLIYVFAPNIFNDDESSSRPNSTSQKGAVGLSNPANDCFINSVLQCLAGLGELRVYLTKETYRRTLDGSWYHVDAEEGTGESLAVSKADELQGGLVTCALKEVLDRLNERPKYRKTLSARTFLSALERAFRQRISRQQQDAQEFLQIVVERLNEEYQASREQQPSAPNMVEGGSASMIKRQEGSPDDDVKTENDLEDEFPFEGVLESQVQCQTCGFRPKPTMSKFVSLTLHVPQESQTTLGRCFDGLLKKEYIDDFQCEKCRLVHAVERRSHLLFQTTSAPERAVIEDDIHKLEQAIYVDPDLLPKDIKLPDPKDAPRTRIERSVRISRFPKIIAIHLSRSIFDLGSSSMKNSARVAFPEILPLGGLLDRRRYKLSGVVTHRGSHHSGHYESFRRQMVLVPSPTPNTPQSPSGDQIASRTPGTGSEELQREENCHGGAPTEDADATDGLLHDSQEENTEEGASPNKTLESTGPAGMTATTPIPTTIVASASSTIITTNTNTSQPKRRNRPSKARRGDAETNRPRVGEAHYHGPKNDKWWRISDENIQETHTSAVLNLQKEVYLLFYERE
ncbi:MAG: hypothetical protein M1823_000856 [Watsoniomyces obsoletus]|nr:MAG: hypothetical protein M1823_000856 [Watsoniomyces obsoletus]